MYLHRRTDGLGNVAWSVPGVAVAVFTPTEKQLVQDLMDKEVHNENALTDKVFFGRHPSRKGAVLTLGERREWIQLRDQLVRLMLSGVTKAFRPRLCCLLGPVPPFLDVTALGQHKTSTEALGLLYTGRAGFMDLGHIRETCDITEFAWTRLQGAAGATSTVIPTIHGEATITKAVPPNHWVDVAQAIANDDALSHEILTYDIPVPGGHNSAFSPEDLCSNFVGTVVARLAIGQGGIFSRRVDLALVQVLKSLRVQTPAETQNAFDLVKSRWVNFVDTDSMRDVGYLKRRNFSRRPFKAGHKSDAATPAWVLASLAHAETFYEYKTTAGKTIRKTDFPAEILRIRAHAQSIYLNDFDKP